MGATDKILQAPPAILIFAQWVIPPCSTNPDYINYIDPSKVFFNFLHGPLRENPSTPLEKVP